MVTFYFDFSDWMRYPRSLRDMEGRVSRLKDQFLQDIVDYFMNSLQSTMEYKNIEYTGTYRESLKGYVANRQSAVIAIEPTGIASEALPIYWKTLEFGSGPIPNLPREPIEDWATTKLGLTYAVARRIWRSIREKGVKPHPILSLLFNIDRASGQPTGLTRYGRGLVNDAIEKFAAGFEREGKLALETVTYTKGALAGQTAVRGPRIPRGQPGAGRWTPIPVGTKSR